MAFRQGIPRSSGTHSAETNSRQMDILLASRDGEVRGDFRTLDAVSSTRGGQSDPGRELYVNEPIALGLRERSTISTRSNVSMNSASDSNNGVRPSLTLDKS